MATVIDTTGDLEEVCRLLAEGSSIGADLRRRVDEEASAIRQEIYQKHGLLNVAVDLVGETRDSA